MQRGEIWLVSLDPTIGSEIRKSRPAVIVSSAAIGRLPLRVVVPFTEWKPRHDRSPWAVVIAPDSTNGLIKKSAADATHVRSVSTRRLVRKLGFLREPALSAVAAAVAVCIDFP
jgi:mRNA interferase MazF